MSSLLGSQMSPERTVAFAEGVAALRRAMLVSARVEDALNDVVSLARRQLHASAVGVWVDASRAWVGATEADRGALEAHRSVASLRDGALRFPLVARGRELGVLVGVWSVPSSLDLATCAAFEELSEYAALALLTSASPRRGNGRAPVATPRPDRPPVPVVERDRVQPVEPIRADQAAGAAGEASDLLGDLRSAIMSEQIHPHFQPVISFSDGRIVAFEALARWEHHARGWVAPGIFIPVAEEHGLIASLGMRMLSDAARQSASWARNEGSGSVPVILNLSPVQLRSRSLVTEVGNVVRRHRLATGRIVLELTGDSFDAARTAGLLERFEGAGVEIAVGDPESLGHLRASAHAVAAGFVKVPRRLVGSVVTSKTTRREIERLVKAADEAGVAVAAEGVETRDELDVLRGLGVDRGQGFLWSPAVPADEATSLLRRQPWH